MRLRRTLLAASLATGITTGVLVAPVAHASASDGPELPGTVPGTCKTYTNDVDPNVYAIVCVPSYSPDWGVLKDISEDGSATYADGWGVDPDGSDGNGYPQWVAPVPPVTSA